jgi:hypothetical protein
VVEGFSAGDLAAIAEQRRRDITVPSSVVAGLPLPASRAVLPLSSALASSPEAERFRQAQAQHEIELRRAGEAARAAAIAGSAAEKVRLGAAVASHMKGLDALVADATVADAQRVLLNKPFLIWPTTHGLFFDSFEYAPANSRAKFKVDSSASNGYEEMSFYFLWDNPSDGIAVINVNAYLVFNGHCQAGSEGGNLPSIISGDRYSQLWVNAHLYLLEWWNQPPTQPYPQADATRQVLFLATNTGGWASAGELKPADVFRGYDLQHTLMLVPPHSSVVFEVAAQVSYSNANDDFGGFASGDFAVTARYCHDRFVASHCPFCSRRRGVRAPALGSPRRK